MSNQFRLVSNIILDAQKKSDTLGMDDRHTPTQLLALFNESVQDLRVRKADLGFEGYLKIGAAATLTTTAAQTVETYSEQDWPMDAANIYGVHVLFETGLWVPLKPISLSGIRDYQRLGIWGSSLSTRAAPAAFALREAPLGVAAVETVGKIVLVPKPTIARQFKIIYLQNWTDVAASATFNGHSGDNAWIAWNMATILSVCDEDSNGTYSRCVTERDRIEKVWASSVPRTQMGMSEEPRRADDDGYDEFGIHELR